MSTTVDPSGETDLSESGDITYLDLCIGQYRTGSLLITAAMTGAFGNEWGCERTGVAPRLVFTPRSMFRASHVTVNNPDR